MKFFDNLFKINDSDYYGISGLNNELSMIYVYNTFIKYNKGIIVITNSLYEANTLYGKLINYTDKVLFFPMDDFITSEAIAISPELKTERINTLNTLVTDDKYIVVTNLMGVLRYLPSKDIWKKSIINIKKGMSIGREYLENLLYDIGYVRDTIVTETGNLGVRGYVLDIFPVMEERPIRIEFWGDEIDSIRKFSIMSQRTTEMLENAEIFPSYEFLLEKNLDDICDKIKENSYTKLQDEKIQKDIEDIKNGDYITKIDRYFDSFYENTNTLIDFLENDFIIFLDEIEKIKNRAESIVKDNENIIKDLIDKNKIVPQGFLKKQDYLDFLEKLKNSQVIYLEKQDIGFVDKQSMHAKRNGYSFSYREVNFFRSSMDLLFQKLQKAINSSKQTVVLRWKP